MSQVQQASTATSRQLYQITRSEATWLIQNYKKVLKKAAEIEPYRAFRDALETQKPAYLGKFNNSRDAAVQGTFYAMAMHIFQVIEQLFKQSKNMNHDAKVGALCKHLPTSQPVAFKSISYLNWAVFNWHHRHEIITEDFADYCLENTTCAICDFKGEAVFYFSTAYGLEQAVCENCVNDEDEVVDNKDGEYVMEEEEVREAEQAEAEASEEEAEAEATEEEAEAEATEEEAEASEADDDSDYNVEDDESEDSDSDASSNCTEETDVSEDDISEADSSEADSSEADSSEADSSESEDERTFGCSGCPYEWRAGFKHGYKAAMKKIRNYADDQKHNVPDAPQCEVCDDSHENLKKCGRCKSVRYCSTECQEEDWPEHKRVCRR
jgi:hypothetical protein